jgi:hypothetical protein
MKKILLALLLFTTGGMLYAQQQPQYVMNTSTLSGIWDPVWGGGLHPFGGREQSIYYPSWFSGAPAGTITNIYLRMGAIPTHNFTFCNFTIRMGYMPTDQNHPDSMYLNGVAPVSWYPVDTVFYTPSFAANMPLDSGDWIKFTLQQPFYYDATHNFLVDFSNDSSQYYMPPDNEFQVVRFTVNNNVSLSPFYSYKVTSVPSYTSNWSLDTSRVGRNITLVGFDIQPDAIADVTQAQERIRLFPNPAQDALHISGVASGTSYSIYDIAGRLLEIGTVTDKTIDISLLPAGFYTLRLRSTAKAVQTLKFTKQ